MKLLFLLAFLISVTSSLSAQPDPALDARIGQVAMLFRSDPGGYDTLFDSNFRNEVSPAQLTGIFTQYFHDYGPVTSWEFSDSSKQWNAEVRLETSKGFEIPMSIGILSNSGHLISSLRLGAATPQATSLAEVASKIGQLHGTAGFLATKISEHGLQDIAEVNADTPLALGSAFKLYVLATLLKDINSGARHWSDVLVLDSASRSFPSGEMHAWPVGTPVTLATAATLMISISDNTAADLLIHALGRSHIEAMLSETGNKHASLDIPFLTTLELFKLKETSHDLGKQYLARTTEARRTFLENEVARFPRDSVGHSEGMIDKIEWYASPHDIANLYKYILDHSTRGDGARVRDILSVNQSGLADKSQWKYIGYKGGSEPGVLNLSYLLQSKAGEWYVVTGTWNDPAAALQESEFEGMMQRALELVQ